jgi:Zn-dependent peptidase ImmA (M78 family)
LNTGKSAQRGRFDAAHELGHLVLHKHAAPNGLDAEKDANRFAATFLMPEASLKSVGRVETISQVVDLKKKWQVSVAAMTYRLHELGIMSKWTYQTLFIEISRRGWRTTEPFATRNETSQVWQKVFTQLRKTGIGIETLADTLNVPCDELVKLVFGLVTVGLPSGDGIVSTNKARPQLRVV